MKSLCQQITDFLCVHGEQVAVLSQLTLKKYVSEMIIASFKFLYSMICKCCCFFNSEVSQLYLVTIVRIQENHCALLACCICS